MTTITDALTFDFGNDNQTVRYHLLEIRFVDTGTSSIERVQHFHMQA